jgi:hypothetical protein
MMESRDFQANFDWRDRSLSGPGPAAHAWAGALCALTSVARLDRLTLIPWSGVLAPRGLMASSRGKWCPHCLEGDLLAGKTPYFRLAWDLKAVTACEHHGTRLISACPECGRTGIRHNAAYVIPGWCTHCGAFLSSTQMVDKASPEAIWIAREVDQILRHPTDSAVPASLSAVQGAITMLCTRLDQGNAARFGKRIGVSKSTVHYWVHGQTRLTLEAALRISAATGLDLRALLTGDCGRWNPHVPLTQLDLDLEFGSRGRKAQDRILNWEEIRETLRRFAGELIPVSLAEAACRLGIDASYLYLHANREARVLGERWTEHMKRRGAANRTQARQKLEEVCEQLQTNGRALNLRGVSARMTREEIAGTKHIFDALREIREGTAQNQ